MKHWPRRVLRQRPADRGARAGLEARPEGVAERLGDRLRHYHPVAVFIGLVVVCYALLASVTIAAGLLFTELVLTPSLDRVDEDVVQWLASYRTPDRNDLSFYGSEVSGGIAIPIVVALVALGFAIFRHWRAAAFLIAAIVLESATYRATVFFVDRERPDVPRLEELPVDASFPSGHIAASIAVYSGLALLLTSRVTSPPVRVLAWTIALAVPVVVGISRMYRGMHHPLDLAAGIVMGIAALVLAVFVARVTGVVARSPRRSSRRRAHRMSVVAVVAHTGKTIGGGLVELRRLLEAEGVTDPLWYEVPKSRKAPKRVKRALDEGAELVFVWGGDGMVQRCADVLAGSEATMAILPAGTANLFASNLGIPTDLEEAVEVGLYGAKRKLDVGRMNGERFCVMAGAGFDARMIRDADGGLKDRVGRAAYVWTGAKNLR